MQNDKILLFIPAYNCEKQIVRVLEQLGPAEMAFISKVIVVNNRSTDQTEKAVSDFMHAHASLPITLLRNRENYGLGGSHKVAFDYAIEHGYDYVIVLHGDDQGSISDFIPVLGKGYYRKHDCILGARFMRGSKLQGYSGIRTAGNIVYNFLFAYVTGRRIYDLKFYPVSWREDDQVSNVKMTSQALKVLGMLKDYYNDPATIEGEYRDRIIDKYEADPV